MRLSEQTRQLTEKFIAGLPEQDQATVQKAFETIMQTEYDANALTKGDQAADFNLPNAKGGQTRLSDLLKQGPLVISFYRGGWCPYCR